MADPTVHVHRNLIALLNRQPSFDLDDLESLASIFDVEAWQSASARFLPSRTADSSIERR